MKKVSYLLLSLLGLCILSSSVSASDNSHQSEDSPEDTIACETNVMATIVSLLETSINFRQTAQVALRDLFDYLYSAYNEETAIDEETLTKLVDTFLEKYTFDDRIVDCLKHHFGTPQEWHYLYEDDSWSFPVTDSILSLPGKPKNSLDAIICIAEEFANLPHMLLDLRDAVILDQTSGLQKMLDALVRINKYQALRTNLADKFITFWLEKENPLFLAEMQVAAGKF